MSKKCAICIVVQVLVGIGALNWGLVALMDLNLVTRILGEGTTATKVAYVLVGLAGLLTLVTLIKPCPCACKK